MAKKSMLTFAVYFVIALGVIVVTALLSRGVADPEIKDIMRDGATIAALIITTVGLFKAFPNKKEGDNKG